MAKRAGAYKSEKRKKELKRQKKQEEKRLRRSGQLKPAGEGELQEGQDPEAALEGEEQTDEAQEENEEQEDQDPEAALKEEQP